MAGFVGGFGSWLMDVFGIFQLALHGLDFGIHAEMTAFPVWLGLVSNDKS